MKTQSLCALLLLVAAVVTGATVFTTYSSNQEPPTEEQMLRSLRKDLQIDTASSIEVLLTEYRRDDYRHRFFAWILVEDSSEYTLMGASRPSDGSLPWEVPDVMISYVEGETGPQPFWARFSHRPSTADIENYIRFSNGWWFPIVETRPNQR